VAHACNPSYSGGRNQEAHGSKPAWEMIKREEKKQKRKNSLGKIGHETLS
jgi:hypothetical protein